MGEAKDKSIDQRMEDATHPEAAMPDEVSDRELEKVAGGDIEQVLNIGSQSSGAGAGKVTFNPF